MKNNKIYNLIFFLLNLLMINCESETDLQREKSVKKVKSGSLESSPSSKQKKSINLLDTIISSFKPDEKEEIIEKKELQSLDSLFEFLNKKNILVLSDEEVNNEKIKQYFNIILELVGDVKSIKNEIKKYIPTNSKKQKFLTFIKGADIEIIKKILNKNGYKVYKINPLNYLDIQKRYNKRKELQNLNLSPKYLKTTNIFDEKSLDYENLLSDAFLENGLIYNLRDFYKINKNLRDLLNYIFTRGPIGNLLVNASNIPMAIFQNQNFVKIISYLISLMNCETFKSINKIDLRKLIILKLMFKDIANKEFQNFVIKNKFLVEYNKKVSGFNIKIKKDIERDILNQILKNTKETSFKDLFNASNIELKGLNDMESFIFKILEKNQKNSTGKAFKIIDKYVNKICKDSIKKTDKIIFDKTLYNYFQLAFMTLLLKIPSRLSSIKEGFNSIIDKSKKNIFTGNGNLEDWAFTKEDILKIKNRIENNDVKSLDPEEIMIYIDQANTFQKLVLPYISTAVYKGNTFPNCVSATLLSLCNIILYDNKTGLFDSSKISGKGKFVKGIKEFYKKYPSIKDQKKDTQVTHNDWVKCTCGFSDIFSYRNKQKKYNIIATHENIYNALVKLFPEVKIPDDDEKSNVENTIFYDRLAELIHGDMFVENTSGYQIFKIADEVKFKLIVTKNAHSEIITETPKLNKTTITNETPDILINNVYGFNQISYEVLDIFSVNKIIQLIMENPLNDFKSLISAHSIIKYIKANRKSEYKGDIKKFIDDINSKIELSIGKKFVKEFLSKDLNPDVVSYLYLDVIFKYIDNLKKELVKKKEKNLLNKKDLNIYKEITEKKLKEKIDIESKDIVYDISNCKLNLSTSTSKLKLKQSQFINIDFSYADLSNSFLRNCNFIRCTFKNTKFARQFNPFDEVIFKDCIFSNIKNIKAENLSFNCKDCIFIGDINKDKNLEFILEGSVKFKDFKEFDTESFNFYEYNIEATFDNVAFKNEKIKETIDDIYRYTARVTFKNDVKFNDNFVEYLNKLNKEVGLGNINLDEKTIKIIFKINNLRFTNIKFNKKNIPKFIFKKKGKIWFSDCYFENINEINFIGGKILYFNNCIFKNIKNLVFQNQESLVCDRCKFSDIREISFINNENSEIRSKLISDCSFSNIKVGKFEDIKIKKSEFEDTKQIYFKDMSFFETNLSKIETFGVQDQGKIGFTDSGYGLDSINNLSKFYKSFILHSIKQKITDGKKTKIDFDDRQYIYLIFNLEEKELKPFLENIDMFYIFDKPILYFSKEQYTILKDIYNKNKKEFTKKNLTFHDDDLQIEHQYEW